MPSTAKRFPNGVIVTPHPLATRVGVEVLRLGGNAVDAAVAANAVLAVVYCGSCGLGGDAFALVWSPSERRLYGFNGSGRSPLGLTIGLVRDRGHDEMPTRGPLTITVPGVVDAWAQLLSRFGRYSLGDALEPAARIAEEGYKLTEINSRSLQAVVAFGNEAARAVFLSGGHVPSPGDRLRQPLLAASLRAIAEGGSQAYYTGRLAATIANSVQLAGGVLTAEDLAAHHGDWVDPISTTYRGIEVATMPPNSQGITGLIALNVLGVLDWIGVPAKAPQAPGEALTANRVHAQLESLKVAWSERDRCVTDPARRLCDPKALLAQGHTKELAQRLHPYRAGILFPQLPRGGGTVYLCAADTDGGLVSLIQSNYLGFGSGLMAGETGIMLQNRGAYFSLDPSHPNRLAPGSRTLHTLMPNMLLRDGEAFVALGAMGGDGQPQTLVQLVNSLVDDGLDPQQAIDRPRFVAEVEARGQPLGAINIESDGATPALLAELVNRGHAVSLVESRASLMGWAQIIRHEEDGSWSGGADPRADSLAAGF